ncbi:UNVERIFIED_CONTAM: hypothetical protein PYX00_005815 [Menopon gallinae]
MEGQMSEMSGKHAIRVFTLNCWGIPYVSKDKNSRMSAIAKHLLISNLDLVCLQEVWSKKDFLFLSRKCHSQLPYSHYFNSFVTGSGLCVLSKHPIVDVYFHQWPINGYAHKIHQGDWFGGKGIGLCKIQINNLLVNLYTAHLHAEYSSENAAYLSHRLLQAFDTSQFVKLTSGDCDIAILAGDLNTEPHDLAIKILNQNAHLVDSFYAAQEKSPTCIGTNESSRNSYSPAKELKRQPGGKRIDYILYKKSRKFDVEVEQYQFPLPDRVPGCSFSYSDHEAIEVKLNCIPVVGSSAVTSDMPDAELHSTLEQAIEVCNDSLQKLKTSQRTYISLAVVFALFLFVSLFVELFFNISQDFGVSYTLTVISFNILKTTITLAFTFFMMMGILWCRSERSAILTGKFSMMLILKRLRKP